MSEAENGWLKDGFDKLSARVAALELKIDNMANEFSKHANEEMRMLSTHEEKLATLFWWRNVQVALLTALTGSAIVGGFGFLFGSALLAVKYLGR